MQELAHRLATGYARWQVWAHAHGADGHRPTVDALRQFMGDLREQGLDPDTVCDALDGTVAFTGMPLRDVLDLRRSLPRGNSWET